MKQNVLEFVKNERCEMGFEESEVKDESKIRSDLGLDSSEVVELSLKIKKAFNLDIELKEDFTLKEIERIVLGGNKNE